METKDQPKHILYVENGIGYGGAIICLRHLVRNLDRNKYLPMVVTGRTSPQYKEIAEEALWKHIPDRLIDIVGLQRNLAAQAWPDKLPGLRFLAQQLLARLDDLINFLPFFIRLLWTTWRFKADLIHANNEPLCNRAALLVAKCLRIPSVCHVRGDQNGSRSMRWAYSLPEHFISVSNWVADSMLQKLNIPREKINVVYDGISLENLAVNADGQAFRKQFNIPKDVFTVGLVGLLIPWKGQDLFLDTAKVLSTKIPNLKMLIIGGTPDDCVDYEKNLRQRVIDLKLQDTIDFTGHYSEMNKAYNGLDIIVSASTKPEPLGTVVIESLAIGKPLVAPNHGGAAEMIENGQTGILFKPESHQDLANSIINLYYDKNLRNSLCINAKQQALKKFSVQNHVEKVQNIYTNLLGN